MKEIRNIVNPRTVTENQVFELARSVDVHYEGDDLAPAGTLVRVLWAGEDGGALTLELEQGPMAGWQFPGTPADLRETGS